MVRMYLPHRDPPTQEPEVRDTCVTPNLLIFLELPHIFSFGQAYKETFWRIQLKKHINLLINNYIDKETYFFS